MILAGVSAVVIVLVMVLTYLVFGKKGISVSNKFTVLDDQEGKQITFFAQVLFKESCEYFQLWLPDEGPPPPMFTRASWQI